jgi:protein-disulfide isomerase
VSDNNDTISIKKNTLIRLAVVGIAALMIASFLGGYNLGGGGKVITVIEKNGSQSAGVQSLQQTQQQLDSSKTPVKVSSVSLDNAPTQGKSDAPVTLIEFSDFQCPFCGSFFSQSYHQLVSMYVDTGKVKFVYKQFPQVNVHPNAREAALASECANEQGKFWPYYDALFGNQTTWANLNFTQASSTFKKYAAEIKLNTVRFNSCLDSSKYSSIVDKDLQEGSTYGVDSTPTFYVGNERNGYTQFVGAQPFSSFQLVIDRLVNSK